MTRLASYSCTVRISGLDCVCMCFPLGLDLVARLRAAGSLQGGIIKGMSGYKTAHCSAHSSFVRLFVRLYSSFTPRYVSSRLVI